jgi:hypothetical protein
MLTESLDIKSIEEIRSSTSTAGVSHDAPATTERDGMNKQVRDLIEAGYVTRKQAAAILGKGDGGNITKLCKDAGVKFIEIPCGTKTTTLFVGVEVVRLGDRLYKHSTPKQMELQKTREKIYVGMQLDKPQGKFFTPPNMQRIVEESIKNESDIMEALGRIEAMLTALLGRRD